VPLNERARKLIGRHSGELWIVGSGRCVWEDTGSIPENAQVMTLNDMVTFFPGRIKHAYSNADWLLWFWVQGRRENYVREYGNDFDLHTNKVSRHKNVIEWPFPGMGSSALPACYVGLALGYDSIILAGVPLDDTGHFFDPPEGHSLSKGKRWSNFTNEAQEYIWKNARLGGKVKSLSGRSREWLGSP